MFSFRLEAETPLLTVTRTGQWSVETVMKYEPALRRELVLLQISGRPRLVIIDIRTTSTQSGDVTQALRSMVARLGHLHPDRTAVVSSSGIAKLEAKRVGDGNARVFTSMVLARDWIVEQVVENAPAAVIHDQPSNAVSEGVAVHIQGPSDVDVLLSPVAALETAKRINDAAVEVLLHDAATASPSPRSIAQDA